MSNKAIWMVIPFRMRSVIGFWMCDIVVWIRKWHVMTKLYSIPFILILQKLYVLLFHPIYRSVTRFSINSSNPRDYGNSLVGQTLTHQVFFSSTLICSNLFS
jgi:hypothetical protein